MKNVLLASVFALAIPSILYAQDDGWTLEKCVSYALENNITLKRQELATQLDKKDLDQSKLNVLPNLNAQVQHNMGTGRVLDEGTYEWVNTDLRQGNLGVASSVTLFKGLQGYNTIQMMKANYLASRAGLELYENSLLIQVVTGYLELLRRTELYEISVEKAKTTELQVERMEMLVEVGNASAGELLEVKAQSSREQYNMTMAKNQVEIARLSLQHLLNLGEEEEFSIARETIPDPNTLSVPGMSDVYAAALEQLPQVKRAEYTIDYFEKNLAVARGALSPEVFARAYYNSNYNNLLPNPANPAEEYSNYQQIIDNRYSQLSVGITIPIFNKWQARTGIKKAKLGLEDAVYGLEDTKQQLLQEIQKYHTDARAALDNYRAAEESNANAEEAYRYMEEKFKVGIATALELEESRNRLFESRAEMVSTKYVFVFYLKILDFYQGKEILSVG